MKQLYRFLGYDLDPVHRVIARDGDLLPMPPKVVDTLLVLVERAGEVVDKDTLIHSVWPDTSVVESSLTRNISLLRKTLAQGGSSEVVIQTVSKRGYRFLPTVEIVQQPGEPADLNARPEPLWAFRRKAEWQRVHGRLGLGQGRSRWPPWPSRSS